MKTKVIGLYGGSGLGKSTAAALVFGMMKQRGYECELVREFAKELAWEGKAITADDQIFILGKQIQAEKLLYGKVDYIITDAPLLLCGFYTEHYNKHTHMTEGIKLLMDRNKDNVEYINFFLNRTKKFNPKGRYETEEQAVAIDGYLKEYLNKNNVEYKMLNSENSNHHLDILEYIESNYGRS
mgnify:CR=1 FL=1